MRKFLSACAVLLTLSSPAIAYPSDPSDNLKAGAYYNQILNDFTRIQRNMCLASQVLSLDKFVSVAQKEMNDMKPILDGGMKDLKLFVGYVFTITKRGDVIFGFREGKDSKTMRFARLYCKRDVRTNGVDVKYRVKSYPVGEKLDKIIDDLVHSINWDAKVVQEPSEEKKL